MARLCGILKIALREDDPGYRLRLAPEDVEGMADHNGNAILPGLYFASRDAVEVFGPRVVERLKRTPMIDPNGKPVFTDDGRRRMFLEPETTLATVPLNMLC